jgi:phage shock protein C
MYCSNCGSEVAAEHRYCPTCGTPAHGTPGATEPGTGPRLSRPMNEKKLAGVCAGIARYLRVDVTLVRILFVVFSVYPPGVGLILYLACWIVMPRDEQAPARPPVVDGGVAKAAM